MKVIARNIVPFCILNQLFIYLFILFYFYSMGSDEVKIIDSMLFFQILKELGW